MALLLQGLILLLSLFCLTHSSPNLSFQRENSLKDYPYKTKLFTQRVDHFNQMTYGESTFNQKFLYQGETSIFVDFLKGFVCPQSLNTEFLLKQCKRHVCYLYNILIMWSDIFIKYIISGPYLKAAHFCFWTFSLLLLKTTPLW